MYSYTRHRPGRMWCTASDSMSHHRNYFPCSCAWLPQRIVTQQGLRTAHPCSITIRAASVTHQVPPPPLLFQHAVLRVCLTVMDNIGGGLHAVHAVHASECCERPFAAVRQ